MAPRKRARAQASEIDADMVQTQLPFKSRKRAATHDIPKGSVVAEETKENVPKRVGRVGDRGIQAPFRATAVQVDSFVKRVYRLIDQKSYLVWGLTSDWAVEAGTARTTRSTHRKQEVAEEPVSLPSPETDSVTSRDDASEGYGEVTAGSIQRLLNYLRALNQHVPDTTSHPRSHWDLTSTSSFIDIGSGYGKVVLHAALAAELTNCHGVEYVASRDEIANMVLSEIKAMRQSDAALTPTTQLDKVSFVCGDATIEPYADLEFSHVYIYDKVFSDKTIARLANNLNQSDVRVLVSYQRPETLFRLGLSHKFVKLASLTMNTTGNQNFSCHIFLKNV